MSRSFVAEVVSGRMVTIPSKFAQHHDIRKGDTIEVEVTSHKRGEETLFEANDDNNNG